MKNDLEKIEAYLNGEMDAHEEEAFRQELKSDPGLNEKFSIYKYSKEALGNKRNLEFIENLRKAERDYFKERGKMIRIGRTLIKKTTVLAAAIGIILIGVAVYYLLAHSGSAHSGELFAEYYEPYTHVVELRDHPDSIGSFQRGLVLYKQKEYTRSIEYLKASIQERHEVASFYIGLAYLEIQEPEKAIDYLKPVAFSEHEFHQDAEWYLCLAYLAAKRPKEARLIAGKISSKPRHHYKQMAAEIIREL